MKITYLGHACFQITSASGTTIITDPYTRVGYELPAGLSADLVTVSHGHFDHNYLDGINAGQVLSSAGEYVYNDIKIVAYESFHDEKQGALRGKNLLFVFEVDGVKICHFGDLGESCRADILEKIADADIVLIPVGGTYTIDAVQAKEYVEKCQPCTAIPMHFRPQYGTLDIAPISNFLGLFEEQYVKSIPDGVIELTKEDLTALPTVVYLGIKR